MRSHCERNFGEATGKGWFSLYIKLLYTVMFCNHLISKIKKLTHYLLDSNIHCTWKVGCWSTYTHLNLYDINFSSKINCASCISSHFEYNCIWRAIVLFPGAFLLQIPTWHKGNKKARKLFPHLYQNSIFSLKSHASSICGAMLFLVLKEDDMFLWIVLLHVKVACGWTKKANPSWPAWWLRSNSKMTDQK